MGRSQKRLSFSPSGSRIGNVARGQDTVAEGRLMSSLVILVVFSALSADPSSAAGRAEDAAAEPRRFAEIDEDIRDALRAEATAENPREQSEAVHRMAEVYREILEDPRLPASDTLKKYKAKLWSRMTRVKEQLQRRQAREDRQQDSETGHAQRAALEAASRSLADQVSTMNYTMGGPSYVFEQGGGALGGGAVNDHGQELIELIERTIKPDFWDTAGGPGSIFYYRPLMALVVSATSEVHDNVGGLLHALRRAGQ